MYNQNANTAHQTNKKYTNQNAPYTLTSTTTMTKTNWTRTDTSSATPVGIRPSQG